LINRVPFIGYDGRVGKRTTKVIVTNAGRELLARLNEDAAPAESTVTG
jgi:hypothetical protein